MAAHGGFAYLLESVHAIPAANQFQVWKTDGSTKGTAKLATLSGSLPFQPALVVSSEKLFVTMGGASGDELFASDLDSVQFSSVASGGTIQRVTSSRGGVLFFQGQGLDGRPSFSDGTVAGTVALLPQASAAAPFTVAGSTAYFRYDDAAAGAELWATDGTVNGTRMVADLEPGSAGADPSPIGVIGSGLLFHGRVGGVSSVYHTDGTAVGTSVVLTGFRASPGGQLQGLLVFGTFDSAGRGALHVSDGTAAGTSQIASIDSAGQPIALGGKLLFAANDPTTGREVWASDGTAGGTQLLHNIAPEHATLASSSPEFGARIGDQLLFAADDGINGRELWTSDGSSNGTRLLADLEPGVQGSNPEAFIAGEGFVLFNANVRGASELWSSDGTVAGTRSLGAPAGTSEAGREGSVLSDGSVVVMRGSTLWRSDGTSAGTSRLRALPSTPIFGSNHNSFEPFKNGILFKGLSSSTPGSRGLWFTDGTRSGTRLVMDWGSHPFSIVPRPQSPGFVSTGRNAFFYLFTGVSGQAYELWSTDGTSQGTRKVQAVATSGVNLEYPQLASTVDKAFFLNGTENGVELIACDDTTFSTAVVATLPSFGGMLAQLDDTTVVLSDAEGLLWRSDGTVGGSSAYFGLPAAAEQSFGRLGAGTQLFVADEELWVTDGTASGTRSVGSMGAGAKATGQVQRVGAQVLFSANDYVVGEELHALSVAATGSYVVEFYLRGCGTVGGTSPAIGLSGKPVASSSQPIRIELSGARRNQLAFLFVSPERASMPFSGCRLGVGKPTLLFPVRTDAQGSAAFAIAPFAGMVGGKLNFQYVQQGGGSSGLLMTRALEVVAGP